MNTNTTNLEKTILRHYDTTRDYARTAINDAGYGLVCATPILLGEAMYDDACTARDMTTGVTLGMIVAPVIIGAAAGAVHGIVREYRMRHRRG